MGCIVAAWTHCADRASVPMGIVSACSTALHRSARRSPLHARKVAMPRQPNSTRYSTPTRPRGGARRRYRASEGCHVLFWAQPGLDQATLHDRRRAGAVGRTASEESL